MYVCTCVDIDCIKIKSEDDLDDSAQQKRKTYKYRVSMFCMYVCVGVGGCAVC